MYIALFVLLLIALFSMVFCHFRRKKIICRIRNMEKCEKCSLVEELAHPFGYVYHCCCGFFSSTVDAWQKDAGYTWAYDYLAPRFQMVFDSLPVYFNYRDRTWLIEFWKGQYGINAGGEIGIYHSDRLLSETEYRTAHFEAANEEEMLSCTLQLFLDNGAFVKISQRHWWLTAFLPGVFSRPSELCLKATVCFRNREMMEAFFRGLCRAGYSPEWVTVQNLSLSFTFHHPGKVHYGFLTRFHRRLSQCLNRMYCRLFLWVTRPFTCTEDRILFLYYYIPFCFRKLMRLRRFHRHCHRKHGCRRPKCCRKCRPARRRAARGAGSTAHACRNDASCGNSGNCSCRNDAPGASSVDCSGGNTIRDARFRRRRKS